VHLCTGVVLGGAVALLGRLGVSRPWLPRLVTWWHRRLGRCLGISVVYRGVAAPGALLAVNHVSWLDIPMLGGAAPVSFVSKAEVRSWPVVGWLAELADTLFLRRGAHEANSIATQIAARLQMGCRVAIFPEGTTSDGRALLLFHARLFAAAAAVSGAPVQPVAIRYGWGRQPDAVAPFIGDDSLLAHLTRVLRHPELGATVSFLPPLTANGLSRRELAAAVRTAIAAELNRLPLDGDAGQTLRPKASGAAASA
jgi:1-acyl-sn-glycerol-3-phosphate acyltransferase